MLKIAVVAFAATLALPGALPADAEYIEAGGFDQSMVIPVSGGCGPNAWRGPWGHCRNTPFHGRLPDGEWI